MVAKVTSCKRCDRPVTECGRLSARKLCDDCGMGAVRRNAYALAVRAGEDFHYWRRRTILALLDLDTSPTRSLDLISDAELGDLLTGERERVLPS